MSHSAWTAFVATILALLPACVFPPWEDRYWSGDDDADDDDTSWGDDDTWWGDDDTWWGDDDSADDDSAPEGFVRFPAGTFSMGSPVEEEGRDMGESLHQVTLTHGFAIGETEVTQGEFEGVMGWDPTSHYDSAGLYGHSSNHPVYFVSWFDMAAYANQVSATAGLTPCYDLSNVVCEDETDVGPDYMLCMNGTRAGIAGADVALGGGATSPYECEGYRLPTEAEWEYAARSGGAVTDAFPAGGNLQSGDENDCGGQLVLDDGSILDDQAWYCGNTHDRSEPVRGLLPNSFDLYDMSGNVGEWCHDWYADYDGDEENPWGPVSGSYRVRRGSYWNGHPRDVRAAARHGGEPGNRFCYVGGRLVLSTP